MISLTILLFATRQAGRLLDWIRDCAQSAAAMHDRHEAIRILGGLDDHLLRDIGLSRDQIRRTAWRRAASWRSWEMRP
jgi:uncharacterized protein YjiS (DUF1127 family)